MSIPYNYGLFSKQTKTHLKRVSIPLPHPTKKNAQHPVEHSLFHNKIEILCIRPPLWAKARKQKTLFYVSPID